MKKLLYIILSFSILLNCNPDETPCDTTPSFSNISTIQISYTSFSITGTISASECDSNIISQGVVYSTSELPTQSNNSIIFSGTSYSEPVTGLSLSTTYYLRPFFENQDGVFYGSQTIVTTLSSSISFSNIVDLPSITSVEISANYSFEEGQGVSADSKGVILNGVEYEGSESASGVIIVNIEGLEPNTNYSYTIFVENEFGTSQSSSVSFQTDSPSSVVSTTTIADIGFTNASLSATYENLYSGEDITTDKGFAVSLNDSFENQILYSSSSNSGIIDLSLSSLSSNTTYYVKAYVENAFGINYGDVANLETNNAGYNFNTINILNIDFETADASATFSQVEGDVITVSSKGFRVSQNTDFSGYTDFIDSENGTLVAVAFENLIINTSYYVKAFVVNEYGAFFSETVASFQTLNIEYLHSYSINEVGYDHAEINVTFNQSTR